MLSTSLRYARSTFFFVCERLQLKCNCVRSLLLVMLRFQSSESRRQTGSSSLIRRSYAFHAEAIPVAGLMAEALRVGGLLFEALVHEGFCPKHHGGVLKCILRVESSTHHG